MSCIFITGTDTDAGKTIFSGLLLKALLAHCYKAVYTKPIQTGAESGTSDLKTVYHQANQAIPNLQQLNSYLFQKASSPHLAAFLENQEINLAKIVQDINFVRQNYQVTIVEGAGGIFVPINNRQTNLDLIKTLNCPVILVAANKLGMINHTLLSINILQQHQVKIAGIVTMKTCQQDQQISQDNLTAITKFTDVKILANIEFYTDLFQASLSENDFQNIAQAMRLQQ